MNYDAIILGAGAAGCMAAIQAGRRGLKVVLYDQGNRIGGKIPISGGGRCNFTNRGASAEHYLSGNPHFAKAALAGFSAEDTETWISTAGIPYHEKTLGQLFCDRSAGDVVGLLERDLKDAGVVLRLNCKLDGLEKDGEGYRAWGHDWEENAPQVVIALGGLSYPNLGANDIAFKLAAQFGLKLIPTAPALDGFVFDPKDLVRFEDLPGVATDVRLTAGGHSFDEALLFTHRGLSGPAALQGSLYWRPGQPVEVDLWPDADAAEELLAFKRQDGKRYYYQFLAQRMPRRLAERWADLYGCGNELLLRISDVHMREAAHRLKHWSFVPAGTTGWHKAEVTRGGVDTAELSQKTMECRNVKGLYFVGEAVDVTGQLGGYNFQWAWASGAAAGRALAPAT